MRQTTLCATAMALILLAGAPSIAADTAKTAAPNTPDTAKQASSASQVDPDAIAALDKMGTELRSHNTFDMKADVTKEDVLDDGQKLMYAGTVQIQARRPDRFRISVNSDIKNREIYYNGKTVTVFSPRQGYYASFDGGPTINDTLKIAEEKYGVELPLSDLFRWGTDPSMKSRIKSAFLVRPAHINGQLCNHYAFRGERADFQIWIQQNGPALPCKLVITNRNDPSMPQYTSVMHWSFPTTIADNTFAFTPPSTARRIQMASLIAERGKGAKQ
jgi:hypothetical protein